MGGLRFISFSTVDHFFTSDRWLGPFLLVLGLARCQIRMLAIARAPPVSTVPGCLRKGYMRGRYHTRWCFVTLSLALYLKKPSDYAEACRVMALEQRHERLTSEDRTVRPE